MSTQIIRFKNMPVITTANLATFYSTKQKNIHDNFRNNTNRFIEGKHYFKLTGKDLKEFLLYPDLIGLQISSKTRVLILWTERGAARHAKMLDTDHAWEVFEQLEDCYFNKVAQPERSETIPYAPNGSEVYLPKTEGKFFIENKKDGTLIIRDANNVTVVRLSTLEMVKRDCQTIRQELELFSKQIEKMERSLEIDEDLLPLLGRLNFRGV